METNQKKKLILRDIISTEFNLIKISETIGGALTHLGSLIAKIRRQPHIDCIIASAETELAEEDRIAFENLEKAVAWFHEKIRVLLPHVKWAPDSFEIAEVNALLNFHALPLNANGYAGSLLFQLRHLYSEVAKEEENCLLFQGWTRTEIHHGYPIEVFDFPDYVDKSLNLLPAEQQLYHWKEKADTSLPCLLRFLKILSLYPTFKPLTLSPTATVDSLPKNLLQFEERQYQATVGYYLSTFGSIDPEKRPLSIEELIKLIERFLYMLEQKLECVAPDDADVPVQVNVVINQFFYFRESVQADEDETHPTSTQRAVQQDIEPVSPSEGQQEHWRTRYQREDLEKLCPIGKEVWKATVHSGVDMARISQEKVAEEIAKVAKQRGVLLHSWTDNRFLVAAQMTDPRRYENHKYVGLKL